jgi:hypothetical protein
MIVTDTLDVPALKHIITMGSDIWMSDGKRLINLDNKRIQNADGKNSGKQIPFDAVPLKVK